MQVPDKSHGMDFYSGRTYLSIWNNLFAAIFGLFHTDPAPKSDPTVAAPKHQLHKLETLFAGPNRTHGSVRQRSHHADFNPQV